MSTLLRQRTAMAGKYERILKDILYVELIPDKLNPGRPQLRYRDV